jgi:hypothetical protein
MTDAELTSAAADLLAQRAAKRARALDEAMDAALDMVRILRRQALQAEAEDAPLPQGLDLAFHRVSRDLRMTCALQERFDRPLEQRLQAAADQAEAQRRAAGDAGRALSARAKGRRWETGLIVEQMVEREIEEREREDAEELLARMDERISAIPDELAAQTPVGELVEQVCRDLDVEPGWDLWTEDELDDLDVEPPRPSVAVYAPP